jgi:predicted RNA-binding Zn-ribbon protein involved in translation (DUF1610 family)
LLASQDESAPTLLDHTWAATAAGSVTLALPLGGAAAYTVPAGMPAAEHVRADADVHVAVYGLANGTAFTLVVTATLPPVPSLAAAAAVAAALIAPSMTPAGASAEPGMVICPHCGHAVPAAAAAAHTAFCQRHHVQCTICGTLLRRDDHPNTNTNSNSSKMNTGPPLASQHWHCPDCGAVETHRGRHVRLAHTPLPCPCGVAPLPLPALRKHRRTTCPLRVIVCRFCGDRVAAGTPSPASDLGPHEEYCGGRTVPCPTCDARVPMKVQARLGIAQGCFLGQWCGYQHDVVCVCVCVSGGGGGGQIWASHSRLHDLQRRRQPLPLVVCANQCCVRPQSDKNPWGLCDFCYGPLYSATYDPDGSARVRRLLALYHHQLMVGCGRHGQCFNAVHTSTVTHKHTHTHSHTDTGTQAHTRIGTQAHTHRGPRIDTYIDPLTLSHLPRHAARGRQPRHCRQQATRRLRPCGRLNGSPAPCQTGPDRLRPRRPLAPCFLSVLMPAQRVHDGGWTD